MGVEVGGVAVLGEVSRSSDDGDSYARHPEHLDMRDATFTDPDVTTFARLDGHGPRVVAQHLEPDRVVLACRVAGPDSRCRSCGAEGVVRGMVVRALALEPLGWRPTIVPVGVPRYRCEARAHVWSHDISAAAAAPRAKLTRGSLRWALEGIVIAHLSMARVVGALGVA